MMELMYTGQHRPIPEGACGEKRVINMLDVPIMEVACTREHWHKGASSFMLWPHYWSGKIDGVFVTVMWKDKEQHG